MKIVNEKGKLFGLINIIDLMVVLILALIIVGGASRFRTKPIVVNDDSKAIITFAVSDIRMATVENIIVGDPIYHYDKGGYIGDILDLKVEPYKEPLESDGKWINAEIPEKYVATFTVEADVRDNPDFILVGGEQTRIGVEFRVKNKRIAFFATVMKMEVQ
ncbi:MAG: DUF4330 domain-containing protein [Tissierellia bacterium]|nr:DUF4330 domain-containing protein [Tissierellia bacterium]